MKKIIYVCIAFFIMTSAVFSAAAQNWKITSSSGSEYALGGPDGKTASLVSASAVSEELLAKISTSLDAAFALPGLKASKASAAAAENGTYRFVIFVESLSVQGTELAPFLPSGLSFTYNTALFYDVLLKVGDYIPKVAGVYVSPDDLLKNLRSATIMPDMYMQDTYVINRLQRLEEALMAVSKKGLFSKPTQVSDDVVLAVRGMYNENPAITREEVSAKLKAQGLTASAADINAVFMVHLGKIQEGK